MQLKEDCNKPVSDAHLERISSSCCDSECSHPDPEMKRLYFFRRWKKRKGSGATYSELIKALLAIDSRQDAERVYAILKKDPSFTSSSTSTSTGTYIAKLILITPLGTK